MKEFILVLLSDRAHSECTILKMIYPGKTTMEDYWDSSQKISATIKQLLRDGLIVYAHNRCYDCGPGNGLAVEWFYKLAPALPAES